MDKQMFWIQCVFELFVYSIFPESGRKQKQFKIIIGIIIGIWRGLTVPLVLSCLSHWLKLPTALSIFPKTTAHGSCGLGKTEMAVGSLTP